MTAAEVTDNKRTKVDELGESYPEIDDPARRQDAFIRDAYSMRCRYCGATFTDPIVYQAHLSGESLAREGQEAARTRVRESAFAGAGGRP